MSKNEHINRWVNEVADLCKPEQIVWCDGSEDERQRLTALAVKTGALIPLNQEKMPGCYLHRSHPSDVARTEHLTFVCPETKEEAGPNNNWMPPAEARTKVGALFSESMKGRTLYVVPFLMGPAGSPFSKVGVELTDSIYVVLNMRIMTRMGQAALEHLGSSDDFTRCLHSLGDLSPDRRYIVHFPQSNEVWSIGSGYGGNALLGKKCLALRIASVLGRDEGWLAEHMLIVGITTPEGKKHYVTGAFPSACGKTNLAMLVPPASMKGWKVETVGDDIAWLRPGKDGRLWAVNPEAGFFGVAPGTSLKTNPSAMRTIATNTIYTNVALKPDGTVWWEGHDDPPVDGMLDWQGRPWAAGSEEKAAHPNSRFTAPASQCPSISPEWEKPGGVPISAILFGARRQRRVPLVYEARSWQHGTFLGATLSSETTAAATGKVGVLRRDPMAMQPFCGYNFGDYFAHWLDVGKRLARPPQIFRVNWFRTDDKGKFLWPGYGENLRVLEWILKRCEGRGDAVETAIGHVPTASAIDTSGLGISDAAMETLLKVDPLEWYEAVHLQYEFFEKFGEHTPAGIWQEHGNLARRVAGI
ncbi:MAG TPA: phosphoenolpyruvate carboxykinase (GTP) [Polyangia bacterium]|nr:phosphoenolpyruvate carboxykinase (GTP) [Polyangia bacterium]